MEKYLVRSSLHDNQEMVVYLDNTLENIKAEHQKMYTMPVNWSFAYEGSDRKSLFIVQEVYSGKKITFSQKEALERIKQENDKHQFGLISLEEFRKRKTWWAKYIR